MKQSNIFLESEGNSWFKRNKAFLTNLSSQDDVIYGQLRSLFNDFSLINYLEVGCSSGFRLSWLKKQNAFVMGIEPGKEAINFGIENYNLSENDILHTDAFKFFRDNKKKFNVICFAHCLYLVPPEELPTIVCGAISSLDNDGYILIYDFNSNPQSCEYKHFNGLKSYKCEFDKLFTWLPTMQLIKKDLFTQHGSSALTIGNPKTDCALSLIRKICEPMAYPKLL